MLSAPLDLLLRVLLAPACAACDAPLEHPLRSPVCGACWRSIQAIRAPWCATCGDALRGWRDERLLCARCRRAPRTFALARSVGLYDGTCREIVHAFKYDGRRVLAAPLAAMMREHGREVLAGVDAIVPVPLHPWRALRRARHGPPQAGLPAARRHANVRHAFALAHIARLPGWRRRLVGRTVVIVDDVMTTGATLDACGRVLLEAGVRSVRALTVARAVAAPREPPLQQPHPSTAPHQ